MDVALSCKVLLRRMGCIRIIESCFRFQFSRLWGVYLVLQTHFIINHNLNNRCYAGHRRFL